MTASPSRGREMVSVALGGPLPFDRGLVIASIVDRNSVLSRCRYLGRSRNGRRTSTRFGGGVIGHLWLRLGMSITVSDGWVTIAVAIRPCAGDWSTSRSVKSQEFIDLDQAEPLIKSISLLNQVISQLTFSSSGSSLSRIASRNPSRSLTVGIWAQS